MKRQPAASVAVLADIHGNLPALSAVLAEPDVAAADAIVLLGDIALGPMPAETLDVLAGLGERAVWVHGNCEREMIAAFDGRDVPGPNGPVDRGQRRADRPSAPRHDRRAAADRDAGHRRHRTDPVLPRLARRDDEMLLVDSPPQRWEAAFSGLGADIEGRGLRAYPHAV